MDLRDYAAEARALPKIEFDTRWIHTFMWRTFYPWMRGGNALELGCFHGAWTGRLYKEFVDVTVVEASKECIDIVKGRWPLVGFIYSTFEVAEINEKFDNIFLLHTLEHVDDPQVVLKKCREWLAPDGRLFVAVPNAFAASRLLAVQMKIVPWPEAVTEAEAEHGHKRTYTLATLRDEYQRAGFRCADAGGIFFKSLAGFQFDRALQHGVVDEKYMEACYALGQSYPDLCASVYCVLELP